MDLLTELTILVLGAFVGFEVISGSCVVRDGEIVHPGAKKAVEGAAA